MSDRDQPEPGLLLDLLRRYEAAHERGSAEDLAALREAGDRYGRALHGDHEIDYLDLALQIEEEDDAEDDHGFPLAMLEMSRAQLAAARAVRTPIISATPEMAGAAGRVVVHDRDAMARKVGEGLVVAVPEFADDQQVPREDLDRYFAGEIARADPAVQAELAPWIEREFRRALINGELLPLNRAFLVNNAALFELYRHDDANREGMIALLAGGAVAPFLLKETDPLAAPLGLRMNADGLEAWLSVARAARDSGGLTAIRLSHDDAQNDLQLRSLLVQRFQRIASTLAQIPDRKRLATELGLDKVLGGNLRPFAELLRFAQALATDIGGRRESDDGLIPGSMTRTDFYLAFVSSKPEDGLYDGGALFKDPHAVLAKTDWGRDWAARFEDLQRTIPAEIRRACARGLKELVDLVYNTNLPDALGGYGLSPQGALPRTALQELTTALQQAGGQERIRATDILEMVRREAFAKVMEKLAAPEINSLTLTQIARVRQTETWRAYIESLRGLLRAPANFGAEAAAVYAAYSAMVQSAVPAGSVLKPLEPLPKMLIQIDAATIEVMWTGDRVIWEQRGNVSETASINRSQLSLQFGVGDRRSGADHTGWTTMTEFHRGAIADPAGAVRTIVEGLERGKNFYEADLVDTVRASTLDQQQAT